MLQTSPFFFIDCIFVPKPPPALILGCTEYLLLNLQVWIPQRSTHMSSFISQWQGHHKSVAGASGSIAVLARHLVQGQVRNRRLKSGCSRPCGILSMSMISQHVSDFTVSLGTQCSEQSNTHSQCQVCKAQWPHLV